jgi:hypothetical protein
MGRKYWKKKSYLFQGFVRENPLKDDKTPENPIRRFIISPQIFNLVKSALMDPELENLPTDYAGGLDFTATKTSKGGYADYSTSKWSRKESALTQDEAEAIEKFGLYNLADFLPKRPNEAELKIMKEMFEASVDGQPYDEEKWGAYFKPRGSYTSNAPATTTSNDVAAQPADRAVVSEHVESTPAQSSGQGYVAPNSGAVATDVPFEADEVAVSAPTAPVTTPASGGQRAEDILAMIRNRQKTA